MRKANVKAKIRAVAPVWSHRITVVRQADDALLISGDGYIPCPLIPDHPKQLLQLDFTHKMRRYVLRRLGKSRGNAEVDGPDGVYQFANATTDEKLVAFVEEFGPVNGKVIEAKPVDDAWESAAWEVTVRETLRSLRREQKHFKRLVETMRLVNRNARDERAALLDLLTVLAVDAPAKPFYDWADLDWTEVMENVQRQRVNPSKGILSVAHQMLCYFLGQHPPGLFSVADGVVDLPRIKSSGVRDALYFQLRLDYLAQRTIGTCLHCHEHFVVYRRGTPACGESCSRALRNARYWASNKQTINASRREKPPNEESRKAKVSGRAAQKSFTGKQVSGNRRELTSA